MDYPANLWDLSLPSLPQQLAPIDDSDFLSILSKQLNPAAAVPVQPHSAIQDASPPITDDSSPSPPAAANKNLAKASIEQTSKTNKRDNEMHKRKIDEANSDSEDDGLEGQPQTKSQKESNKKGKRKSTGDESRALKRKEQNRAAQRAFRERKEKHVKDLEDQVAALETKSQSQASENESLRELLSRLQNENLMLKQSAFTFNFSNATTSRSTPTTVQSTDRPSPPAATTPDSVGKSNSSPSSAPAATPSDSPQVNLGLNTASGSGSSGSGFSPLLSFSTLGGHNNNNNGGASSSSQDTFMSTNDAPLTFFSPPPPNNVPSSYINIASNPMYTSYTDFSAWDQFFQETSLDQTLAGVTMPSSQEQQQSSTPSGSRPSVNNTSSNNGRMEDLFSSTSNFNELIPFSSFSPINPINSPLNGFNGMDSESPVTHSSFSTSAIPNAFSLESRQQQQPVRPSPPARTSSPCGGADPDEAPRLPSLHGMTPEQAAAAAKIDDGQRCPKSAAEVSKLIEQQPVSTLGTFPSEDELKHYKIKQVWETVKAHPDMKDLDMDQLCAELRSKARCDGTLGDKPCAELKEAIANVKAKQAEIRLQSEAQAKVAEAVKQQQASLQGATALPSIFSTPATSQATSLDMFAFPGFTMGPSRPSLQAPRQSVDSGSSVSTLPTPVSASADMQMMDSNSWMMNLDIPGPQSPTSQYLSYLNMGAIGTGGNDGFSPNSYLNLPEKE